MRSRDDGDDDEKFDKGECAFTHVGLLGDKNGLTATRVAASNYEFRLIALGGSVRAAGVSRVDFGVFSDESLETGKS